MGEGGLGLGGGRGEGGLRRGGGGSGRQSGMVMGMVPVLLPSLMVKSCTGPEGGGGNGKVGGRGVWTCDCTPHLGDFIHGFQGI